MYYSTILENLSTIPLKENIYKRSSLKSHMKNHKSLKFILLVAILAAVIFFGNMYDLQRFLNPTAIDSYVSGFGVLAPLMFILLYIIATVAFLPGTPITIAAGILFGTLAGTLYVAIGATIGASLAFLLARWLGAGFVSNLLKGKFKKLYEYDEKLETNGLQVVLLLRLLPLFPFNGLNFAFGLTKVSFKDHLIGTFFGILPGSFALVYFGNSLKEMNVVNIIIAVVLLLVLTFGYPVYKRYKKCKPQTTPKVKPTPKTK